MILDEIERFMVAAFPRVKEYRRDVSQSVCQFSLNMVSIPAFQMLQLRIGQGPHSAHRGPIRSWKHFRKFCMGKPVQDRRKVGLGSLQLTFPLPKASRQKMCHPVLIIQKQAFA
jgi:hypothetical protein